MTANETGGEEAGKASRIGRTVLVVDDDPDDRELIRRLLRHPTRHYRLLEATSGAEGLELVRRERPEVVLLDHFLPDMDGIGFLDALRRGPGEAATLPVAMLSGQESDEVAAEALRRGAQDYLIKDAITGPTLMRSIENAIEKFSVQRDLVESRVAVELRNRKLEVLQAQLQEKLDELAEATRARDQFMAVMSHEMRTPLNAIIGYADLLDLEIDGPLTDGQRAQVARIQVGGRHLLDLINDVLDLARADAAKLDLDIRPVNLRAVVEEVVALLERQAEEKGLQLTIEPFPPGVPLVEADLHRLRQILTNLVGNAIKFTEEGSVRVACEVVNGSVRVDVEDTGIGIEPEVLPLVFSEFFQARGELTREKGGTGLGLAISLRLAHLMGGDIVAESRLGEGSTFTLTLIAAHRDSGQRQEDVEGHHARMELQSARSSAPQRHPTVAVVAFGEKEEPLRELADRVAPGVRLSWTTDAEVVASLAAREAAALVLLDISSPNGTAWRAAQAIQNQPGLGETAILLLPTIPAVDPEQPTEGLDLGWMSLIPKPFTETQLRQAVSAATRGRQRQAGPDETPDKRVLEVLIVDDDPDSRRVAAKFLSQANLLVREAADGESALVEMHQSPPDVVVLDLMMPVLDGFGVLATMRADSELVRIPVVVLTAKSLTEGERDFLARTAVRVLQKGEYRLADVASLVLRAAARAQRAAPS